MTAAEAIGTESYDTSVAFQNVFAGEVDIGYGLQIWRAARGQLKRSGPPPYGFGICHSSPRLVIREVTTGL